MTVDLPPGPLFLWRLALRHSPTTALWYGVLSLFVFYSAATTPTWLAIPVALFTQLVFIFVKGQLRVYRDKRDAEAKGAVMIPQIQKGGLATIAAMAKSAVSGYPADIIGEWREEYGEIFNTNIVFYDIVFTSDPEHIKAALSTQFDTFEKGPVLIDQFQDFLGSGVFNADGDMWKFHRGMSRPFFNRDRITDFDNFDRHATDAIGQMVDRLNAGYPIDFQDVVSRFTIDAATEFLFGADIRTLSVGLPYPASSSLSNSAAFLDHPSTKFVDAFLKGLHLIMRRQEYGPAWPLAEFWKNKVKPHRKVVDQFIEPILAKALETVDKTTFPDTEKPNTEDTLLNHLIKQTQDTQVLKDELLNLLVAGRDTTASTLTFAVYMLTQHPSVIRRLREEILQKVGKNRPTFQAMKDMKYLRAFINETLRLYPVVPLDSRTSNKATVFPPTTPGQKPFYIPANRRVVYSAFLMHRRTDLWGPDADTFDPDRFIDERLGKYLTRNPFIFVPFHAGPRICLGQQFAYHEMSYFLICLLQRFSGFSLAEDAQPLDSQPPAEWAACKGSKGTDKIWPAVHLTMYVKGGLWVRMEEAHSDE